MTKKRMLFVFCVSLMLIMALSFSAFAASGTFTKTRSYADGTFSDLADSAWYYKEVVSAYELGLMNGMAADSFGPDGSVTVGQGIALASRVHSLYNGGDGQFQQGDVWYQVYVDYAVSKGFVAASQFDDYNRPIKRYEMATLFADALPAAYYTAKNNVTAVPDVPANAPYASKLLLLYNAGIVMGNDAYGTFYPQNNIKRSEVSAIINRVALPENRLSKTLAVKSYGEAAYLIDSITMNRGQGGLTSGWDYDNRYQILNANGAVQSSLYDTSDKAELFLKRTIDAQSTGVLTLEMVVSLAQAQNGAFFTFTDTEGSGDMFKLFTKDGFFWTKGDTEVQLPLAATNARYKVMLSMDLDTRAAYVTINGVPYGTVNMSTTAAKVNKFVISTTKENKLTISPSWVQLYVNYLVNDGFFMSNTDTVPVDWAMSGNMAIKLNDSSGIADSNTMYIEAAAGSSHTANKQFAATSGNVIFESYILLPKGTGGAYVSLNSGNTSAVKVLTKDNMFYKGSGETLRAFTSNIWQCIRIEANTATQKAVIRIDGKKIGEFAFDNAVYSFDNITIGFNPAVDAIMWFDDIQVFKYEEPADYVPVPVPAKSDDYYVMMNVCDLWRNDHHTGWDAISPYPDLEPVLGFYDDGIVETMDWENKYMIEHGIDSRHLCWYSPSGDLKYPIKTSRMNDSLHDGFFNSKYSDMIDFTFMWENSGQNVKSLDQFKEFLWPYWIEYYFTDPRFTVLDNKPVMTIWSYGKFISAFTDEAGAKEAIAFMKEDIKKLGFDGMIILFADGHNQTKPFFEGVTRIGADGTYGYHWQQDGKSYQLSTDRMTKLQGFNATHIVPTVSVGFNNIGWSGERKDLISLAEHKKVSEYIRDTFLPKYSNATEAWKKNTLIVSTWNEYGEGTYTMPAGVHGFGYLDNIRSVFTKAPAEHQDLVPTASQKARLGHLYPEDRSPIRPLGYEALKVNSTIPTGKLVSWDMSIAAQAAEWKNMFSVEPFDNKGGVLKGTATRDDFAVTPVNESLGLDLTGATHVHVRMKSKDIGRLEIFYTTETDTAWNQAKNGGADIKVTGEFVDYYVDMRTSGAFKGKLKQLRIDPNNKMTEFEISLIEILMPAPTEVPPALIINDKKMEFDLAPVIENDEFYYPANPTKGFFTMLNAFYEFSRFSGKLHVYTPTHDIVFTIGSTTAVVDGTPKTLAKAFEAKDGLPMIPIKFLLDNAGISYKVDGRIVSVTTIDQAFIDAIKNRKPNEFEFNVPGDPEGWKPGNASISVQDGALLGVAVAQSSSSNPNYDPALTSPDLSLNALAYKKIVVGMSYEYEPADAKDSVVIYFKTTTDTALDEKKTLRIPLETNTTNGKIVEYVFDTTLNEKWTGTITGVRFDPNNKNGTFMIDYIRFVKDPNVADTPTAPTGTSNDPSKGNLTDKIFNGDAEDTTKVAFSSDNAAISIVADADKAGNHVYKVDSKKDGKNWLYARQEVKFVPGTTYIAEFDVKITGLNDGTKDVEKTDIFVNLIYADTEKNDHNEKAITIGTKDGWQHVKMELKPISAASTDRSKDVFSFYANPVGDLTVNYMLDNVKITAK